MIDTNAWAENVSRPVILNDRRYSVAFAIDPEPLLSRATHVAPICDPVKIQEPLQAYQSTTFGIPDDIDSETKVPDQPADFHDPYLYPTLTTNEYLRLNVLWYYTRGLNEDTITIKKLDRILELVKISYGWEIAIIGLLDAATYSRFITNEISLAVIPRRESTCSHTVNIQPGTVLTILDLSKDWRYKGSPAVENGGLRSYAGTQLRLVVSGGESVALGSLCIASSTVQEDLTRKQKIDLLRTADMITNELVTRTKLLRLREKQMMMESLAHLRGLSDTANLEVSIKLNITKHFPECQIEFLGIDEHTVSLGGGDGIPLSEFVNNSWEDAEHIQACALDQLNFESKCDRAVRALIGHVVPNERVLIVSTTDIKYVFDDIDTWFIEQCAQIYGAALQSRALKEALAAKETFLRTITHELRTPIHGILSSVELMMTTQRHEDTPDAALRTREDENGQSLVLQNIKRSGVELMNTVNNILRLNSSTHDLNNQYPTDYNLFQIENDVLVEALTSYNEDQLYGLSVRFEYNLCDGNSTVRVDADLLKELLKCLMFNAVAATPSGTIRVVVSLDTESTMQFNFIDDGHGVTRADHERIFLPFEKLSLLSKGSGLGLSLARRMANALGGKVELVSSAPGQGSHFRVTIPSATASGTGSSVGNHTPHSQHIDWAVLGRFHTIRQSARDSHMLEHFERHLELRGLARSEIASGGLVLMNMPDPLTDIECSQVADLTSPHVIVVVCSTNTEQFCRSSWSEKFPQHSIVPLCGPFHTARLDEALTDIALLLKERRLSFPGLSRAPTRAVAENDQSPSEIATPPITPSKELEAFHISSSQSRAPRALLVDDNSVNLSVLQMFCKKRKIPSGTAVNGQLAFDAYRTAPFSEKYDLILLDLQMPVVDGVEACRLIRAHEKLHNLQPAIIFMITGQGSVTDRKNSFGAGVDDFFVKPVSLKKLDQAIQRYFEISNT